MRPVKRDDQRIYSRLCLSMEHLEEIYRLVVAAKHRFEFEYGDDVIEGIQDFDKLREMRKSPRQVRVSSEQIRLLIQPWRAELDTRYSSAEGTAKLLLDIDNILRHQEAFWYPSKVFKINLLLLVLSGIYVVSSWFTEASMVSLLISIVLAAAVTANTLLFISVLRRRVKIKWGRQLHFAPILEKVLSSVIAGVIVLIIAFFGGVYLQPVVKPFLDQMFSH
jgi:hypothetical protein